MLALREASILAHIKPRTIILVFGCEDFNPPVRADMSEFLIQFGPLLAIVLLVTLFLKRDKVALFLNGHKITTTIFKSGVMSNTFRSDTGVSISESKGAERKKGGANVQSEKTKRRAAGAVDPIIRGETEPLPQRAKADRILPIQTNLRPWAVGGAVIVIFGIGMVSMHHTGQDGGQDGQRHLDDCIDAMRRGAVGTVAYSDPIFRARNTFQSAKFVIDNCAPYTQGTAMCKPDEDTSIWEVHILSDSKQATIWCHLRRGEHF